MNKPPLVFIPGWGADRRSWAKIEALLQPYYECSHCELLHRSLNVDTWPEELEKIAELIPERSVVLAWSLGGMLATQLASRYPQLIKKLVLIATNPSFTVRDDWLDAMPIKTFEQFCAGFDAAPERTLRRFNALQAQGYEDTKYAVNMFSELSSIESVSYEHAGKLLRFLKQIDNTQTLFELQQPVLNIFAEGDALVPISVVDEIERRSSIAGKKLLENVSVAQCGHAPHYSHAHDVFGFLKNFLDIKTDPYQLDKKKVAASFSKASSTYDKAAQLQLKVAKTLCAWSPNISGRVLDLGCGTGYCLEHLQVRKGITELIGLDIADSMLTKAKSKFQGSRIEPSWCNADLECLPFVDGSIDTLTSSLAIQWSDQLSVVFSEAERVLKAEGQFIISSLGPETLSELNQAWCKAQPEYIHVNRFLDADAVMSAALASGFEVDFFSIDYEILNYATAKDLMKDLKAIGAHNMNGGSARGLTGKKVLRIVEQAYEQFRLENSMLPATYQVYYWIFRKRRVLK